jgi:hypothetical protein
MSDLATSGQITLLIAFAEHQKAASSRLGRVDWVNQLMGAAINVMITAALSQEARSTLLSLVGQAFHWIVEGIKFLTA